MTTDFVAAPEQILELSPGRPARVAARLFQLAALLVVLAVSTLNAFELDRFFVPKELVLHVAALVIGLLTLRGITRVVSTRVDLFLTLYLVVSALSAVFATNHWAAIRAVAISASGVALFWSARWLRSQGLGRRVLNGLAFAVFAVAVTSLLQTYGVESLLFSENRAPGGTLGNRNFVAHAAAFGMPLLLLAALRASSFLSFFFSAVAVSLTTATLVLTRSRAAWIAFAAVIVVFVFGMIVSPSLRRDGRTWRRWFLVLVITVAAVAAALALPNSLRWRSRNPYLQTVKKVADYQRGSGHGRLIQYERSLVLAAHHPILGAGPGNWAVDYPEHAAPDDPSLNESEGGMTTNPWPSSDWVALISERGVAAVALIALAFMGLVFSSLRQLSRSVGVEEGLLGTALIATLAGAGITGLFDAVLLLALPTLIVWPALGALWLPDPAASEAVPKSFRSVVVIAVLVISAVGAARSGAQLTAMAMYVNEGDRASLERASQIDPGNYRLQLRLARIAKRETRCEHARAAHGLFPNATAAKELARNCR